ncbi:MAG TPA: hypothetical protein VIK18_01125 [Pirellulales bacterium]
MRQLTLARAFVSITCAAIALWMLSLLFHARTDSFSDPVWGVVADYPRSIVLWLISGTAAGGAVGSLLGSPGRGAIAGTLAVGFGIICVVARLIISLQ